MMPDWRNCSSTHQYIISVNNWLASEQNVTLRIPFIAGYSLRDLVTGTKIDSSATVGGGVLYLTMGPNEERIFIATPSVSPAMIMIDSFPGELVPNEKPVPIELQYDASNSAVKSVRIVLSVIRLEGDSESGASQNMTVIASTSVDSNAVSGTISLSLMLPQSSGSMPSYPSTDEGGRFILLAELYDTTGSSPSSPLLLLANSTLDVLISFGIKLLGDLPLVSKNHTYINSIPTGWERLFSLSRTEAFFPRFHY